MHVHCCHLHPGKMGGRLFEAKGRVELQVAISVCHRVILVFCFPSGVLSWRWEKCFVVIFDIRNMYHVIPRLMMRFWIRLIFTHVCQIGELKHSTHGKYGHILSQLAKDE